MIRAEEYGVVVEQLDTDEQAQDQNVVGDEYMTITKIVPIYDILAINFDLKTKTLKNLITYDPNKDDPLNKYTYEEKHGGLNPPQGTPSPVNPHRGLRPP